MKKLLLVVLSVILIGIILFVAYVSMNKSDTTDVTPPSGATADVVPPSDDATLEPSTEMPVVENDIHNSSLYTRKDDYGVREIEREPVEGGYKINEYLRNDGVVEEVVIPEYDLETVGIQGYEDPIRDYFKNSFGVEAINLYEEDKWLTVTGYAVVVSTDDCDHKVLFLETCGSFMCREYHDDLYHYNILED